ncbi:MAG: undecaprenyl-diphosphate phosphatase [bacterium]|nr:undecaprenyl-diphosphate phosphatase [bacterium]
MNIIEAGFIGFIQAVTEFLPVSSSGHLATIENIIGLGERHDPGFVMFLNVLVHFATFVVTILYYRKDILAIFSGLLQKNDERRRKTWQLVIALVVGTIPAGIVGLSLKSVIEASFSSMLVVGGGFLLTSAFLTITSRLHRMDRDNDIDAAVTTIADNPPTVKQALIVGCLQAVAILPGISRSGSTICSGLLTGLPADIAVRFSFLLSLPAVLGAAILESRGIGGIQSQFVLPLLVAFSSAVICGWFAMALLVRMVRKLQLTPFAWYTAGLGIFVMVREVFFL